MGQPGSDVGTAAGASFGKRTESKASRRPELRYTTERKFSPTEKMSTLRTVATFHLGSPANTPRVFPTSHPRTSKLLAPSFTATWLQHGAKRQRTKPVLLGVLLVGKRRIHGGGISVLAINDQMHKKDVALRPCPGLTFLLVQYSTLEPESNAILLAWYVGSH